MISLHLAPVDTLFFRDSTPFSSESASQAEVGGLFPPHPASMVGAVRAALARLNGWSGRGRWPRALDEVLGDGPDDLGRISVEGPFLIREGQPLFPVPLHLLGSRDADRWRPRVLLRPGSPVSCDLGEAVRLPEVPRSGADDADLETGQGWWLTQAGLETVLRGGPPGSAEVVSSEELWHEEGRIGIERDPSTRTAREGMLYSTRHVRLRPDVALGVRVSGVPREWARPVGHVVPLGGESRFAVCQAWEADPAPSMPLAEIQASGRMAVVALSPLDLAEATWLGREPLESLGHARVVSACLDRPDRIGGWNSLTRRPLPVRSLLPPGSVLFCEVADPERLRESLEGLEGLPRVGARQAWGFGAVAIGTWPGEPEVTR